MKRLFIIANWKSYKTIEETEAWFTTVARFKNQLTDANKEIIICPPFPLLSVVRDCIKKYNLSIQIGVQNISPFDEGKYTGEVNGRQIKEVATYVIIGHSERRQYFKEDDTILQQKIAMATKYSLQYIYCIQNEATKIFDTSGIVAYEPVTAIGTGKPDTPEDAENVAHQTKAAHGVRYVLYGGSTNAQNVNTFTAQPSIDGVLVGGASLDPEEFVQLIIHA